MANEKEVIRELIKRSKEVLKATGTVLEETTKNIRNQNQGANDESSQNEGQHRDESPA